MVRGGLDVHIYYCLPTSCGRCLTAPWFSIAHYLILKGATHHYGGTGRQAARTRCVFPAAALSQPFRQVSTSVRRDPTSPHFFFLSASAHFPIVCTHSYPCWLLSRSGASSQPLIPGVRVLSKRNPQSSISRLATFDQPAGAGGYGHCSDLASALRRMFHCPSNLSTLRVLLPYRTPRRTQDLICTGTVLTW